MMNVYGTGGERIVFRAMNSETGDVLDAEEQEPFRADVIGTIQQPFALHIGEITGIAEIEEGKLKTENTVYDLQGRRVEESSVANGGVYIVTDGTKTLKRVNRNRSK
jgi:hypothetical protein